MLHSRHVHRFGCVYQSHLDISTVIRILLMLLGWLTIYVCSHAIAHWLVGRLVGIRFRGYGIRGTDHPESYPSGMREIMSVFPFFTVMTNKATMQTASPIGKALMFAAGETSTSICSVLAGLYAWQSNTPGGFILLLVSIVMAIFATMVTWKGPKGDYASARRALRGLNY
jgi:hypothetical protein